MTVAVVYEGSTDRPVVRKLTADAGLDVLFDVDCHGKSNLDKGMSDYNEAARGSPWLVLRDLDDDAPCGGDFLRTRHVVPSTWMCFRLAVRALEAWLMADADGVAAFFSVEPRWIPAEPDREADPKASLLDVVRRSRDGKLRRGMLPAKGGGRTTGVGVLYQATIIQFAETQWSLARACTRSPSLTHARAALHKLATRWRDHLEGGAA